MALRGPEALASLDEALRDIRREEDEIAKRLARSNEVIAKFRETEADLFRQLAMVRLDPSTQNELAGTISQAEAKARDLMKAHAVQLAETEEKLKTLDAAIGILAAERAEALGIVDARSAELKGLSERIATEIAKDPTFAAKRVAASEQRAIAEEAVSKTEQAEADRETKGEPYRNDPLFMYLWNRNFGTSAYKAGNLVRYLDGKVANLVGFAKARPNYAMLNEIPARLREHAERQSKAAEAADAELGVLERAAIDAAGGRDIREALEAAQARIATIDARIVEAEDERDEAAKMLRQLAQGSDPAFEQALSTLAQGLGREDLQTLLAEARRTRTGQDDTLVGQIDEARARVREEEAATSDQRERLKTLASRRRELEDIQFEFKKARFDDPRSTFRQDSLIGDVLTDFLRGGISAASYWDQWRRSQDWAPGTSDWGGGIGLPDRGRSRGWDDDDRDRGSRGSFEWPDSSFGGGSAGGFSWPGSSGSSGGWGGGSRNRPSGGGGFSRPRSGSTGSRKHGGFKTGGGF